MTHPALSAGAHPVTGTEKVSAHVAPADADRPPAVVAGEVVRIITIEPYPNALTALGGCTSLAGTYVVDPDEIAAIHFRVRCGR